MHDIKFRAWDIISKKMLQWGDIFHLPAWEIFPGTPEQRAFNVMQYTGIKESRNLVGEYESKEIYEGDIIKEDGWDDLYVVEFKDGSFIAKKLFHSGIFDKTYKELDAILWPVIVGNIYENPELLEVKA